MCTGHILLSTQALQVQLNLSSHTLLTLPTGPVHLSARWHLQMNYGRWLSSLPGSHTKWRSRAVGSRSSHYRTSAILEVESLSGGPKTTSIKPPLILIHFVVSRELLLIKCVPGCIMGVSWVSCMKLIHNTAAGKTLDPNPNTQKEDGHVYLPGEYTFSRVTHF